MLAGWRWLLLFSNKWALWSLKSNTKKSFATVWRGHWFFMVRLVSVAYEEFLPHFIWWLWQYSKFAFGFYCIVISHIGAYNRIGKSVTFYQCLVDRYRNLRILACAYCIYSILQYHGIYTSWNLPWKDYLFLAVIGSQI